MDAVQSGSVVLLEDALKSLSREESISLLCNQKYDDGNVPLHLAARKGDLAMVKLIVVKYDELMHSHESTHITSSPDDLKSSYPPPWLAKNDKGCTPLHMICRESESNVTVATQEAIVFYLSNMDFEHLCNNMDNEGCNPLYYAVTKGYNIFAEQILNSHYRCNLHGRDGLTVLHLVSTSSENVCKILLKNHPELLKKNDNTCKKTVLHEWAYAEDREKPRRLLQLLMEWDASCVLDMIYEKDKGGENPLATAIIRHNIDYAKDLSAAYHTATNALKNLTHRPTEEEKTRRVRSEREGSPWTQRNNYGDTPFLVAIYEKCEENWLMEIVLVKNY